MQVDEMTHHIKFHESAIKKYEKEVQTYQQKIDMTLKSLRDKGINVCLEDTKMAVAGASRVGYAVFSSEEIGKLYDELRKEIDICEKAKGKTKHLLNIVCDAVIAVSSLDHDFFVTTDRCLSESWNKIIGKHETLGQQFKIPEIIYAERSPEDVANRILTSICTLEE